MPLPSLSHRRIVLADDDPAVIQTFAPPLEEQGLSVTKCSNGVDLQRLLADHATDFDAIVTDLWNMGTHQIQFIPMRDLPRLVQTYPYLHFIVFSCESYQALQYADAGVRGYVLKSDGVSALITALKHAFDTNQPDNVKMYISPSIEYKYRVSHQERHIIRDAAQGLSIEQTALRRHLSPKTVDTYRTRLMNKFRQSEDEPMSMTKVVAIALREGIIR